MDILDEELLNLWRAFSRNKLRYIMVGGFATNLHGFLRTTGDADIWIENSLPNRISLRKSLSELGVGDFEAIESMDFVPGWSSIHLLSGLELDIMTHLKGFEEEQFDECYQMASKAMILDVEVPFLHINHLIAEKTACNRPKDKIDVKALKAIRKLKG
jgi:hypothetical protein